MIPYDDQQYQPPAPIALLTLRTLGQRHLTIAKVPALVDTGADITLLPRWAIEQLNLIADANNEYQLEWIDGSKRSAETVDLEVALFGGRFQGRYAIIDQSHGVVGRNLLNHFRLLFDGPAKTWQRIV